MSDRTMVTGTPGRVAGPLRGQVLGERYEVRAQLRNDAFSLGMLAFDQETEERVVLRILRPELLDHVGRNGAYRALRASVGVGGRFLPGLTDADIDGELVFAVEPVPEGASLRDVLDQRIADDRPMTEAELLPLISHLETALAAVPPPLRHGDVRAENVWVDPHRLWLLGAFVVPALPDGAVAALLQKDSGLRRRMAPEVLRGSASDAADRFGVGAIVYEALTLKTPPEPGEAGQDLPPTPAGEQVRSLLHPDPGLRAKTLEPLIDALARSSGLAVPELDPGTFRAPRRLSVPRPGSMVPPRGGTPRAPRVKASHQQLDSDTQQTAAVSAEDADALLDASTTEMDQLRPREEDGLPPPPSISEDARTRQVPLSMFADGGQADEAPASDPEDEGPVGETARLTPLAKRRAREVLEERLKGADLDPRLVRAALERTASAGHVDEEAPGDEESRDSIDPRLVRAALGIELTDSEEEEVPRDPAVPARPKKDGTQELRLDELEVADEEEEVPLDPSVPVQPKQDGTQELRLDELETAEEEVPLDPSAPARPRKDGTQELRMEDLEVQVQGEEQVAVRAPQAPARDMGLADLEEMRRRRQAVPEGAIQPIPRPRKDSLVGVKGPVLFDDSSAPKPQPRRPMVQEPAVVVRPPSEPPPKRRGSPTDRPPAPRLASGTPPRERNWGVVIIIVALVLGAAIIIGSFGYARFQKSQAEDERRQQIQDRIERLRGTDDTP